MQDNPCFKEALQFKYLILWIAYLAVILSAWSYLEAPTLEWRSMAFKFEIPSLSGGLIGLLASVVIYNTAGRLLYSIYFYKILSFICHDILDSHKLYISTKLAIWCLLTALLIAIINIVFAVVYNLLLVLWFLILPAILMSLFLLIITITLVYLINLKYGWSHAKD